MEWAQRAGILRAAARNGWRTWRGRDYFHQPQPLGRHFVDRRAYYNDMRGKADWPGDTREGVPVIGASGQVEPFFFPITIIQFGLGSLDRLLESGQARYRHQVDHVATWLLNHLNDQGHYPNRFDVFEPGGRYLSDNSAMAQGEALSFLCRVHALKLDPPGEHRVESALHRIAANLVLPLEAGGCLLETRDDVFLCEVCHRDKDVVLNGWLFGLFGLGDYVSAFDAPALRQVFERSVGTLGRQLHRFVRADGWTLYDTQGRISSPFYHALHGAQLEAVLRLGWIDDERFAAIVARIQRADRAGLRLRYTLAKIREKLFSDGTRYRVVQ